MACDMLATSTAQDVHRAIVALVLRFNRRLHRPMHLMQHSDPEPPPFALSDFTLGPVGSILKPAIYEIAQVFGSGVQALGSPARRAHVI